MASIRIKLDKKRANEKGLYPVRFAIFNNQTNTSISLNLFLPESAWLGDGLQRPINQKFSGSKLYNDQIEKNYLNVKKMLFELEESGKLNRMTAVDIKKYILSYRNPKEDDVSFYDYAETYISTCKAQKTAESYRYTVSKLKSYDSGFLMFEDLNNSFLRSFDDFLIKEKASINTRSIHFRNIRSIFNRAIDDEIIQPSVYPFRKFKIKNEQRNKECLTKEQVKTLYDYEFETDSLKMARDFWMLSFLLCGINPIDLFTLKKPDKNNRVSFVRTKIKNKTSDPVKMLLQPEALELIERYKADQDSEYLLCFESKYLCYDNFKSFVSKKIREIAKITGLEGLTLYWARYSWATIADSLDIQEKTISKALGHTDKSLAGRKYIAFDWSKIDHANRKVIDYVLYK